MHAGAGQKARPGFYFQNRMREISLSLAKSESCTIISIDEA